MNSAIMGWLPRQKLLTGKELKPEKNVGKDCCSHFQSHACFSYDKEKYI